MGKIEFEPTGNSVHTTIFGFRKGPAGQTLSKSKSEYN